MHSPGPWRIVREQRRNTGDHKSDLLIILNGHDRMIVSRRGIARPTKADGVANAALMAAAPDLYEACKGALLSFERAGMKSKARKLRAALRKAEATA